MACNYVEQLSGDARARYKVQLSLSGLEECPYRLAADIWEDDPTQWPSLEYGDVYNHEQLSTNAEQNQRAEESTSQLNANEQL